MPSGSLVIPYSEAVIHQLSPVLYHYPYTVMGHDPSYYVVSIVTCVFQFGSAIHTTVTPARVTRTSLPSALLPPWWTASVSSHQCALDDTRVHKVLMILTYISKSNSLLKIIYEPLQMLVLY